MTVKTISTFPDLPDHTQQVTLGGRLLTLRMYWLRRLESWFLDVSDADGPVAMSRRLSPSSSPLRDTNRTGARGGAFVVIGPDPYVRSQLGKDLLLLWVDADTLATLPEDPDYTLRAVITAGP